MTNKDSNDEQLNLIESFHSSLDESTWGAYYLGKFYFSISTKKKRADFGLLEPRQELSLEAQLRLQQENFPALFHEYIHYLHELSTVIGNVGLGLDLCAKARFSNWLDASEQSSVSNGFPKTHDMQYVKAIMSQQVLMGSFHDSIDGTFIQVVSIDNIVREVYFPYQHDFMRGDLNIPVVNFEKHKDNQFLPSSLFLGKFFLYEGVAYELDRQVDKQYRSLEDIDDTAKGTEYVVLRSLAEFIFPGVRKRTFLSLAVMSLQYVECGNTFIRFLEDVKIAVENGVSEEIAVNNIAKEVSDLLVSKREDFQAAQDEYLKVFESRQNMYSSYKFLTDVIKKAYDLRIQDPCFEVNYVFEGRYRDLLDEVQICDYMYLFEDEDDYMRDFLGTSISKDISQDLKTVVCHDHYYQRHKGKPTVVVESDSHKCPFYHCCDLEYRKVHQKICENRPWRIYEIAAGTDNQQCWYGTGVLEFKGHSRPTVIKS